VTLERKQIENLIREGDDELFVEADRARRKYCGDEVHLRGIVEFSNVCSRNCLYCGLRRDNTTLPRYTMGVDEVMDVVSHGARSGVRTIVLQSGENDDEQAGRLADTVSAIKQEFDVAVTLCVGVKSWDCYGQWRQAGADRYLLKHETATPALYRRLHPDSGLGDRLSTLAGLRALGYQIGSGCIIGLPGQTPEDLAADVLLAGTFDVDMAAFGPFVPHPSTPLAAAPAGDIDVSLRVVAAARLVLGSVHIPATTAFDAIAPDGRERALRCGANVIMANLTPDRYRRLYTIYPSDRSANSVERVKEILARLDRPLSKDHGHSLKRSTETKIYGRLQGQEEASEDSSEMLQPVV
jgi:biotin synthase